MANIGELKQLRQSEVGICAHCQRLAQIELNGRIGRVGVDVADSRVARQNLVIVILPGHAAGIAVGVAVAERHEGAEMVIAGEGRNHVGGSAVQAQHKSRNTEVAVDFLAESLIPG